MTGVFIYQSYRFLLRYKAKEQFLLPALFVIFIRLLSSRFETHGIPYGWVGPVTIFLLLFVNTYFRLESRPKLHRKFFDLGNLTYSSYLLHFPIQLIMLLIFDYVLQIDFTSQKVFALYLMIVLITSYFVSKYFELPLKSFILKNGKETQIKKGVILM